MKPDNLTMHTPNLADENYAALAKLFPSAVTETMDENGTVIRAIDKDILMQEINTHVVEGREERYQFTWPDKRKSMLLANAPLAAALRPCRKESVNFDTTKNLYIEGDNLDVLKLLRETYLNRVKMIYIDPPYNTGNDFIYEDDFAEDADAFLQRDGQYDEQGNRLAPNVNSNGRFHTDWLNMMYPRLRIAKDLLSDKGILVISIGYHEVHNLVFLCQNIFANHQVMAITVQTSGGKPNGCFSITHEYLVFVAPPDYEPIPTEKDIKKYATPYHGMNLATFNQVQRPNQAYPIYVNKKGIIVGCGKSLQERMDEGSYTGAAGDFVFDFDEHPKGCVSVWPVTTKNEQCVWRLIPSRLLSDWEKGYIKVVPIKTAGANKYSIQYLSGGVITKIENGDFETYRISKNPLIPTIEVKDYKTAGAGIASVWTDKAFHTARGSTQIKELFDGKGFSYPKPLGLINYLLEKNTHDNDLILDFFSGSATTAHAVMQRNAEDGGQRQFILVQLPEVCDESSEAAKAGYATIPEIGKERIRRAGHKIKEEYGEKAENLDIGFRVLKLDSSNMKDVYYTPEALAAANFNLDGFTDNIKEGRSHEDLLFQVMLDLGIPLSGSIASVGNLLCVNDNQLIACFDRVDTDLITDIAKKKPHYAIFRDSSFADDSAMVNFEQVFNTYSPNTIRKVL